MTTTNMIATITDQCVMWMDGGWMGDGGWVTGDDGDDVFLFIRWQKLILIWQPLYESAL